MVRKRQWFLLGLLGTLVGMAVRLVRRRQGDTGGWEPPKESS
jgi:hypothetical protein